MVSALMTARKAKEVYKFPSMELHGNSVQLNNTDGKSVVVAADQLVYMRGKGNFGIYEPDRDAHRKSQGYDGSSMSGKIGTSKTHPHETDIHSKKKPGLYRKMFGSKQDRSIYD